MRNYQEYAKEFGTVNFEGKEYALTQDAYINGQTWEEVHFLAEAIDQNGNVYTVRWEVKDDFTEEDEDHGFACNWDAPSSVIEA